MVQELISIVVPVYNVENYLRMCLDSILNQTYQNFECLLINDGSPDNSLTSVGNMLKKILAFNILSKKMLDYQMHVIME